MGSRFSSSASTIMAALPQGGWVQLASKPPRWLRPSSETLDRPTAPTGQNRLRETRLQPGRRMGHHHRAAPTGPQAARRRIQAGPHGQDGRAARELIERQRQGVWVASAQGREVMKRVARHPGLCSESHKTSLGVHQIGCSRLLLQHWAAGLPQRPTSLRQRRAAPGRRPALYPFAVQRVTSRQERSSPPRASGLLPVLVANQPMDRSKREDCRGKTYDRERFRLIDI